MCEFQNQHESNLDQQVFERSMMTSLIFIALFNYEEGKFHQQFKVFFKQEV